MHFVIINRVKHLSMNIRHRVKHPQNQYAANAILCPARQRWKLRLLRAQEPSCG
jgi:hypothetical protein